MSKTLEGMARHDMAFAQGMISAAQQLGYFVRDEEGCRVLNRIYERASDMRLEGRKALRAAGDGMRVLVACEFSGAVRRAFRALGHDAWSCDLLPAEDGSEFHLQRDVSEYLSRSWKWDLMICHPPCTHLAVSGARHFKNKVREQEEALAFVHLLLAAPIPRIALENPISIISTKIRKPDQIIQPWMFGHGETKATCLWLKNLPKLVPTNIVEGREARVHRMSPGPNRWKERSRTFAGIAEAMADQWGGSSSIMEAAQ